MTELGKILIAFGAGFLSFFTPCILPLIPAYICFITGLSIKELSDSQEKAAKKNFKLILMESILFVLGFSIVFVILGASVTFLGSYLLANQRIIRIIGGAVVILFGLHLIGIFNIKALQYEKKVRLTSKPIHIFGSFLVGVAFGFGWTPCVGPILASILVMAATRDTLAKGILLLSSYSLGLGVPFIVASLGIGWISPLLIKINRFLKLISVISGILLLIIGIGIITGGF